MLCFENIKEIVVNLFGNGLYIGIVMSCFNFEVGEGLLLGVVEVLQKMGVVLVMLVSVLGVLEIFFMLQIMVQSGKYDVLIVLGCVICGEIYYFEVVFNELVCGIIDVQLNIGIFVVNGVLIIENDEQVYVCMKQKGYEVVEVVVELVNFLKVVK